MTKHDDWLEDVKRWYFAGRSPVAASQTSSSGDVSEGFPIGYEAAHPALQARHWPELSAPVFSDSV